jgi:hypothetical protein
MRPRTFLGGEKSLGGTRRVYEIEDGLEVDENSFVEIERTRVYFDDVVGITYHQQMGGPFLVAMALFVFLFAGLALIAGLNEPGMGIAIMFLCFAVPFVVVFILRLALKVDVITIFGQRTMARMNFDFRKQRARDIYRDLTQKIRACQEKAAAAVPKPPPPPAPDVPLPPSPPAV